MNNTALVEKFENGLNSMLVDKIYNLPEMPVTLKRLDDLGLQTG